MKLLFKTRWRIIQNVSSCKHVPIHHTLYQASAGMNTQDALLRCCDVLMILWVKRINRPNNNLQTLAYNVDSIEWKCCYRCQSIIVTLNAFLLSINQNNWKPQFSHPWSIWDNCLSKKVTESAIIGCLLISRQCFDQKFL